MKTTLEGRQGGQGLQVLEALLFLFLMVCIFFPGDPIGVKIPLFLVTLILSFDALVGSIKKREYLPILLLSVVYPALLFISSLLLTSDIRTSLSGAYPAVLLILVIVAREKGLRYQQMVLILLKALVVITLLLFAGDLIGLFDINEHNFFRNSMYGFDMGMMGKSENYATYYKIYFKASPLLLLLLNDTLEKRKYVWAALTFATIVLAGARAGILAACALIVLRFVFVKNGSSKIDHWRVLVIIGTLLVAIFAFPFVIRVVNALFFAQGSVASDAVRSGEYLGYFEQWKDPLKLLFGTGFGSEFYNYGRGYAASTAELSYFEMVRNVGLLFAIPFFAALAVPLVLRISRGAKIAYLMYLVVAYTNPLLFSSTAFIMYTFVALECYKARDAEDQSAEAGIAQENNSDCMQSGAKSSLALPQRNRDQEIAG